MKDVSAKWEEHAKTVAKSTDLNKENVAIIPKANPKSPTRLTSIALIADLFACNLVYQKLIKR